MTIETITAKVERWRIAFLKACDTEIRLNKRLDMVRHRRERLEAKIKRYGAYASYYQREGK